MTDTLTVDDAREVVAEAKREGKAIELRNVGANVWLYHNPYTNHRDAPVDNWDCISYTFQRRPGRSILSYPNVIKPWRDDAYAVNTFTTEWVVAEIAGRLRSPELYDIEESPFAGDVINDWD